MASESRRARTFGDIPFSSTPVPLCHPDRAAAVATLFGLNPQRIECARVLELGCGSGGNLIPLADLYPESNFVGLDGSEMRIQIARHAAEIAGLTNVEFHTLDAALPPGTFDYLVCRDVSSTAGPEDLDKILALSQSMLKPGGVACFGYDTQPGCLLPNVARQLVHDHTSATQSLASRVAQTRQLLTFFSESVTSDDAPFARLFKQTADQALAHTDQDLAREMFLKQPQSFYFHQFVERAESHDLRYVADTEISSMFTATLPRSTEQNLRQLSSDQVSREQHLDWLRNRAARHTLLCHHAVPLAQELAPERLHGLFFAARLWSESAEPDVQSATAERFATASGPVISSTVPIVKAALVELSGAWPRAIAFDTLARAAAARAVQDGDGGALSPEQKTILSQNLLQCLISGFVEPRSVADKFVTTVTPRPRASWLARLQAESSPIVTNRRHEPVTLDELSRNILPHLDGEHDRASLLAVMTAAVERGQLSILMDSIPASRGESVNKILERALDDGLTRLARESLLMA